MKKVIGITFRQLSSSLSIVRPTRCTSVSNLFYFGMTLYISDGLSVHQSEFKTVHTVTGICLLASLLYVQSRTPDNGLNDRPKHVECHLKIK